VNVTIGTRYIVDTNELENNIHKLVFSKYQLTQENNKLHELTERKDIDLIQLKDKIDLLNSELDKVKKENNQIKKELDKRKEAKKVFEVTAYSAGYESTQKRKGDKGYGITASGTKVKEGRTISCPPSMEFGTKVDIQGVGIRTCEDRGSAIKSGHIDLYMDTVNEALDFGRQKLLVKVVEEENV
jgi:3D (Asp-Asp-Asp) domain-containing protein